MYSAQRKTSYAATKVSDDMQHLDSQMQQWASRLRDDLRITPPASNQLASTIVNEVRTLESSVREELLHGSPIPFRDRLDELTAFQAWMDCASSIELHPAIARAQVITQNYVCFVYLGEAWFTRLRRSMPSGTATKKCSCFLTDNPVRAFRNAFAHANWKYNADFSGLEFWARKGADTDEPLHHFEVSQTEMDFWQALARCLAYASYLAATGAV